jgi:hypothetical protein
MAREAASRAEERCDLCGDAIGAEHRHLLQLATREVLCICRACVLLMDNTSAGGGARQLIPTRCLSLADWHITAAQWQSLQVPVNVAFFCYNTGAQRITAFYPSPLGPTEAAVSESAWQDLVAGNPILAQMVPDVEALLVHRGQDGGEYYLAPIDECYRLVGLIRLHWRGLSGGTEVRKQIERYFGELKERATIVGDLDA